jgi:hypothetical protein
MQYSTVTDEWLALFLPNIQEALGSNLLTSDD